MTYDREYSIQNFNFNLENYIIRESGKIKAT
jgi:hypothetical protein